LPYLHFSICIPLTVCPHRGPHNTVAGITAHLQNPAHGVGHGAGVVAVAGGTFILLAGGLYHCLRCAARAAGIHTAWGLIQHLWNNHVMFGPGTYTSFDFLFDFSFCCLIIFFDHARTLGWLQGIDYDVDACDELEAALDLARV
jgi:hypothetical protein